MKKISKSRKQKRKKGPNILVLGTPGVGKSSLCQRASEKFELQHINIGQLIKDKKLYEEWDITLDCSIFDEDKLNNEINALDLKNGGFLLEFHACYFLDKRFIDHVIVLRTEIEILGRRLEDRGYSDAKISENIQCEIFQVLIEEAVEHFGAKKVSEYPSNNMGDQDSIIEHIEAYLSEYSK